MAERVDEDSTPRSDGAAAQGCVGLNMFSSDGNTPTGLAEIDLNSPEDESKLYGPFPVNRFVRGLRGNAEFLLGPSICDDSVRRTAAITNKQGDDRGRDAVVTDARDGPVDDIDKQLSERQQQSVSAPIRSGILVHTGAWANHSRWVPGQPMPNSAGCVHAYPDSIREVWRLLVARGVAVRPNTDGKLPYPYVAQGLAAVPPSLEGLCQQ